MTERIGTGIPGLNEILEGGLLPAAGVLIDGMPGTGKTTFGLQYLVQGALEEEPGIYITFEELPEQLYRDAQAFGWDLRSLEGQDRMRVVATSPETFIDEIRSPGGLVEETVQELGARRIVIDSISLLTGENPLQTRYLLYSLRSALKRLGLTALLIKERTEQASELSDVHPYLFDSWIRLTYTAEEGRPNGSLWPMRYLEVLKHRGSNFVPGRHLLRFRANGLAVAPGFILPPRRLFAGLEVVASGVPGLDQALGGGLIRGGTYILDTNSKANYGGFLLGMLVERLRDGDGAIYVASSTDSPGDLMAALAVLDIDLAQVAREGRFLLVDPFARDVPPALADYVLDVSQLDDEAFYTEIRTRFQALVRAEPTRRWYVSYDMNGVVSQRGFGFIHRLFAQHVAGVRRQGYILLALLNFAEIPSELGSFLERTSAGVIRTWFDGHYQFAQVIKSPLGHVSEPLAVVPSDQHPFMTLF